MQHESLTNVTHLRLAASAAYVWCVAVLWPFMPGVYFTQLLFFYSSNLHEICF